MNPACLTTEPVNVLNMVLALGCAVASVDLGGRSHSFNFQNCILLGVEETH